MAESDDEDPAAAAARRPPPVKPLFFAKSPSPTNVDALARLVLTVSSEARECADPWPCWVGDCDRVVLDNKENWELGLDVTANAGGGVRVRIGVGTMG